MSVHAYCRKIQLILYATFYSFTRLIFSSDIFLDYPQWYTVALIGLFLTLLLAYFCAGEIMKATMCALVLPHHSKKTRFENALQQVGYWYTTERCHECGVIQAPTNASRNREFAGAARSHGSLSPQMSTARGATSFRGV